MIEFDQYLGFLAFLAILSIGFWLMIFLLTFVIRTFFSVSQQKRSANEPKATPETPEKKLQNC